MPRIPEIITNSIVYLYRSRADADQGAESGASGFLLSMEAIPPHLYSHVYVVTNRHVIEGPHSAPVVRMNLRTPKSEFERIYIEEFQATDWVLDPHNDLAVCALKPDFNVHNLQCSVIPDQFLVTEAEFKEQDIGPGDGVVYVGRFVGHAGVYENTPSVRFGNISMNPNEREPIVYDTDAATRRSQVGFLVEARSRSGYSGSPVFFLHQHAANNPRAVWPAMDMRLLGVDWGHLPEKVSLRDPQDHLHGSEWYVEVHAGMMGVIPAWHLLEFLKTSEVLKDQRARDHDFYATDPAGLITALAKQKEGQQED